MKRQLLSQLVCLLLCIPVYAQWHADPSVNLLISEEGKDGQSSVIAHPTPDGKIFVSWLEWAEGMNAYIKLQLLDKQGYPLFEEGGIYVAKQQTASWTGGYDMKVTPDGCAIIAHSDSRNDDTLQAFEPHVYKVDQEGNFLWGLTGVPLPTMESHALRPQIGVTNKGNVLVGYADLYGETGTYYTIAKVNNDGTLGWAKPLHMNGMFGCFAPCEEDDLFLSIINNGALTIHRLDIYGEDVWGEGLVVDNRDLNTRSEIFPILDGKGNIILPYQRYINQSVFYSCMQRVSPEGELFMGLTGIDLWDELGQHSRPGIAINSEREEIVAYWDLSAAGTSYLYVNKYTYNGDPIWEKPIELDNEVMWGYAGARGTVLDDGSFIMVYGDYAGAVDCQVNVVKCTADGTPEWQQVLGKPGTFTLDEPQSIFDEEEMYVFWSDDRLSDAMAGYGSVYGQNILYADGSCNVAAMKKNIGSAINFYDNSIMVNASVDGKLYLYNTCGALIKTIDVKAGANTIAANINKGIYIARLVAGDDTQNKKIIVR